jgi:protein-disulfide isomerase
MRFSRKILSSFTVAALLSSTVTVPAQATDITVMTATEQDAFGAQVRAYLLENPEVIMEAVAILQARDAENAAQTAQDALVANAALLYENPDDLVLGNPDGDITMVEFVDYRCGYCKKAHPEVKKLLTADGNIKLIVKEFPILGEASTLAARFAIATKIVAGDASYARLNDALMTANSSITEGSLRRTVRGMDIDADAVFAMMDDVKVDAIIAQNHTVGRNLGINGTPAFIIQDQIVGGYMPYDNMVELIAELRG